MLYADDILLLSPTVCELQNVLHMCERELDALDLTINIKKFLASTFPEILGGPKILKVGHVTPTWPLLT